jgi:hypothetical protein
MATLAGVRSFDRRMVYLLLAFAVLGVLLILISTSKYGAGCWPDCVAYVSTARNLLSGGGYWMYAERPFAQQAMSRRHLMTVGNTRDSLDTQEKAPGL